LDVSPPADCNIFLFNRSVFFVQEDLNLSSYVIRTGGEIIVPFFLGGIYFNSGEFVDFIAGVIGLDPASDDGKARGEWRLSRPEDRWSESDDREDDR